MLDVASQFFSFKLCNFDVFCSVLLHLNYISQNKYLKEILIRRFNLKFNDSKRTTFHDDKARLRLEFKTNKGAEKQVYVYLFS